MKAQRHVLSALWQIVLAFYIATYFGVSDGQQRGRTSLSTRDVFQRQTNRIGFGGKEVNEKAVVLLQEDGSVDYVKTLLLELPSGVALDDITFFQVSSNEQVLNIADNGNLLKANSDRIVNVTCTLSFDEMVGKTTYTLSAKRKSSGEIFSSVSIPFTITGMTFFTEVNGKLTIVSGATRKYEIPYQDALPGVVSEARQIRVVVQYPDGSSSSNSIIHALKSAETLRAKLFGLTGQFRHDDAQCKTWNPVALGSSKKLVLPSGCGYGFYTDFSGHLCFGILFEPYRAGNFRFEFTWPGLTSSTSKMSTELFETSLDVFVSGTPPVAVGGILPSHGLFRPEGGEFLTCTIINADRYNISYFFVEVTNVTGAFEMIPGSFKEYGFPFFNAEVSFVTEPGSGTDLSWSLYAHVGSFVDGDFVETDNVAAIAPGPTKIVSYDNKALRIDRITPSIVDEQGGTIITVEGYFSHFDASRDGVFLSGIKLQRERISSVSSTKIIISSPPKSVLGESYEFFMTVMIGNGVSNEMTFSYIVKHAEVRVSQSGTTEISEDFYGVGDCTPVRFTAVVVPFTKQIESYHWTFFDNSNSDTDLLKTEAFVYADSTAQTLELLPDSFDVGTYTLRISVQMFGGNILETEILLERKHVTTIGAFILKPPERSIAFPDTPLRLSAVVRPPGDCYSGNQTMIFQWEAFGEVQTFSAQNASDSPAVGQLTTTPARLGWEYVVPREVLTVGTHTVVFKVWMDGQTEVSGQAMARVVIRESSLEAVIRQGEDHLTANYLSILNITGTRSYDPDIVGDLKNDELSYEWSCRQSSSPDFSDEASSTCISALLPNTSPPHFPVNIGVIEGMSDVNYLQYQLVVRKGSARASKPKVIVVEIKKDGKLSHLEEYSVSLNGADGKILDWSDVPHYEQTILEVTAPNATWTYELVYPNILDFFSSSYLISSPLFYSLESNIFSVSGNAKSLGIEAGKLSPSTTYMFRILFDKSEHSEATSVTVSIRTSEAPTIGFPTPSVTNGTTETMFTLTAGIPSMTSTFSYYFILTDSIGNEYCVGGCTGYDVVHFQIGRPGNYSMSAYVLDMQGKALLDSATLKQRITVVDTGIVPDYFSMLGVMFANGNDNSWTHLARDLALILLEPDKFEIQERMLLEPTARGATSLEDLLAARMGIVAELSIGSRKIYCTSYPNSYHGWDCMQFALVLSKQPIMDESTVYNILQVLRCCVKKTPARTVNRMGFGFPTVLGDLHRLAKTIYLGGSSRRRLLNIPTTPANLIADLHLETGESMAETMVSAKLAGYAEQKDIGNTGELGQVSVVVASNPQHLPARIINGKMRKMVGGRSQNEMFYATDQCLSKVFSRTADKRRVFLLHTTENFVRYGFQDDPIRPLLAENLYRVQVYERNEETGHFGEVSATEGDYCFCWRLPIERKQAFLESSIDDMPGLLTISNLKSFNKSISDKGEAFTYVYTSSKTSDFNAKEGWVEACRQGVGLVASTIVPRDSSNVLADPTVPRVLGLGAGGVMGVVLGGLALVVIAIACSWIFAVRSMSDSAAPMATLVPNELYVERDVYGRETIFDVNAVRIRSNE